MTSEPKSAVPIISLVNAQKDLKVLNGRRNIRCGGLYILINVINSVADWIDNIDIDYIHTQLGLNNLRNLVSIVEKWIAMYLIVAFVCNGIGIGIFEIGVQICSAGLTIRDSLLWLAALWVFAAALGKRVLWILLFPVWFFIWGIRIVFRQGYLICIMPLDMLQNFIFGEWNKVVGRIEDESISKSDPDDIDDDNETREDTSEARDTTPITTGLGKNIEENIQESIHDPYEQTASIIYKDMKDPIDTQNTVYPIILSSNLDTSTD